MRLILPIFFLFSSLNLQAQKISIYDSLVNEYNEIIDSDSCELAMQLINRLIVLKPSENQLKEAKIFWLKHNDCYNVDSIYACYSALIELNENEKDYYFHRGSLMHREGGEENFKKALIDFEKVISLDSFYFPAYEHVQTYYFYHDAKKSAKTRKVMRRKMEEAVDLDSSNAYYWHWLGQAWDICNHSSGAKIPIEKLLDCQNRAIELDSTVGGFYWQRGLIFYDLQKNDECIYDMTKANSSNASTIYITYISLCYERKGNLEKAMQVLDDGLKIFPDHFQLVHAKKELSKKMKTKK